MGNQWESAIIQFETQDRVSPLPKHPIVFAGSSTFTRWASLAQDFPDWPVLNRGFGGSQMADILTFADRIILAYRPRGVIVYSGDNDLASGKRVEEVHGTVRHLVCQVRSTVPATLITFLSVKYSPVRMHLVAQIRALNERLAQMAKETQGVEFLEVASCLMNASGQPVPACYDPDGLHLSAEGYRRWMGILRPYLERTFPTGRGT
jgi:lysophospholipase L1-like esterase